MLVEARIAYPSKAPVIRLKLDGIAGQGMLLLFEGEGFLEQVHERVFPSQALFPIQQEITKPRIARFRESSGFADSGEGTVDQCWFQLVALNPSQDLGGTVASILTAFMGLMPLEVVIADPLVCGNEFLPGLAFLEIPISHAALHIERGLHIGLPALALLDFHLFNAQGSVNFFGLGAPERRPHDH